MSRYKVGDDPYVYTGTETLQNHFGIRDLDELEIVEQAITENLSDQFSNISPPFDLRCLQSIHGKLFNDIYPWAGELRTCGIKKGNTVFCMPERIVDEGNRILSLLEQENNLEGLSKEALIPRLSWYYDELNVLHPFREGNGRAQRLFFRAIIVNLGYNFKIDHITAHDWTFAFIHSYNGDMGPLSSILDSALEEVV